MTPSNNISEAVNALLPADLLSFARLAAEVAHKHKTRAVLVGGVVRDMLLNRPVVEADFMVEPPSAPVAHELAHRTHARLVEHDRFQTFNLTFRGGRKIDLVTARQETYPAPAILPKVTPSTIDADLSRRDFTINAMACWIDEKRFGELLDPFNGRVDMSRRSLRALHETTFFDDPTRIYRAARFAGRLGFTVESKTRAWIAASVQAGIPGRLSAARKRHEFELILKDHRPTATLQLLKDWDMLRFLHPDWTAVDVTAMGLDGILAPDEKTSLLEARLTRWLRWWGPKRAQDMMTELSFERAVKRSVTDALLRG